MKWNIRRHRGGSWDKKYAQRRLASGGPPEAHLAAHLCATQWLRGGWPPLGGWPLATLWRAARAMILGKNSGRPQRPSRSPPCSPTLCHPVAERWLVPTCWLASGGPLEGRWCYVSRERTLAGPRGHQSTREESHLDPHLHFVLLCCARCGMNTAMWILQGSACLGACGQHVSVHEGNIREPRSYSFRLRFVHTCADV